MFGYVRFLTMITTDIEYQQAVKELLDDLNSRLTDPGWMPISHDEQSRFIHRTLERAHKIVNSEPYLRGKVIDSLNDVKDFDAKTIERDRDRYRETAANLYEVLLTVPATRLGNADKKARAKALEAAEKVL